MYHYFPSCNFTRQFPEASRFLSEYTASHYGMIVEGCCRPSHKNLQEGDVAVTVCQNCSIIIREQLGIRADQPNPSIDEISIFELLCEDDEFPWPDLHGEAITLQDCFRAKDKPALHEAVRKCLRRMNAQIVELPENRENSLFCGSFLMDPASPSNQKFAPHYYKEFFPGYAKELPPEEQTAVLKEHVSHYTTPRTVCYCNKCTAGVKKGGGNGIHLMELMLQLK